MANICSNNVTFDGPDQNLDNLMKAYEKTSEIRKNNPNCHFVLFEPGTPVQKYCSQLQLDWNGDNDSIYFETNWGPDPVQLIRIARMFSVSFFYSYEELGSDTYGEFHYDFETDTLKDRCLTEEDIQNCKRCGNPTRHPSDCDPTECEDYENNFEQMDEVMSHRNWDLYKFDMKTGHYQEA
jgi:hypothetical protein